MEIDLQAHELDLLDGLRGNRQEASMEALKLKQMHTTRTAHEHFELQGVKNNYGQPRDQWWNYSFNLLYNYDLVWHCKFMMKAIMKDIMT
jgi:hypothetical protein